MSFHGGTVGVVVALILFCRQQRIPLLGFADRLAVVVPMGLGIGRLANFINGELWGREAPAGLPWAIIFDTTGGGPVPRHPSQLYQSGMEGFLLLLILALLCRRPAVRARFGMLTGVFLVGYGIARSIGEIFREPDNFLGFLIGGATMGQFLSVPMVLAGLWLISAPPPRAGAAVAPDPWPAVARMPLTWNAWTLHGPRQRGLLRHPRPLRRLHHLPRDHPGLRRGARPLGRRDLGGHGPPRPRCSWSSAAPAGAP